MEDRELLEMAAKAYGPDVSRDESEDWENPMTYGCYILNGEFWRPLDDDGDAFRLMVKLSLRVEPYTAVKINDRYPTANITDVYSLNGQDVKLSERHGIDSFVATRRAIVRAAAEIGKSMP